MFSLVAMETLQQTKNSFLYDNIHHPRYDLMCCEPLPAALGQPRVEVLGNEPMLFYYFVHYLDVVYQDFGSHTRGNQAINQYLQISKN